MRKLGIIVHRYGNEVNGGGEYYAMLLAERLIKKYDVEIITTTSLDYTVWDNHYKEGKDLVNGIPVNRFPVELPRRKKEMDEIANRMLPALMNGQAIDEKDAYAWIDYQGPYCPKLIEYLKKNHDNYDVFIFITYLYYHTVYGLPAVSDRAIFIPTAHDEPWLHLSMFSKLFRLPRRFLYCTQEEQDMVHRMLHNEDVPGEAIGVGIDIPEKTDSQHFRKKYHVSGDYLVFVGRIDASKKCDEIIQYFIAYKKRKPGELKLVLIGKANMEIPLRTDILCTGFVSEEDKFGGLAGAKAVIAPSRYESLCMALLEGFAVGIPAMVNGDCAVLRGHCERSGAGIIYTNEQEFHQAIDNILDNESTWIKMSENARAYVQKNYIWQEVMRKIDHAIEEVVSQPFEQKYMTYAYRSMFESGKRDYITALKKGQYILPGKAKKESVAVAFVSSNAYAPYLGIVIYSILKNASADREYDIVVLVSDFTAANARRIDEMVSRCPNISVRFFEIRDLVNEYTFYKNENYNEYTYYRLLLPELMKEYKKFIYLDCDVIVNTDIGLLYDTDVEKYCIAGCWDPFIMTVQCAKDENNPIMQHFKKWGLVDVGCYFQGGVQLINPKKINEICSADDLLKKASENQFVFCDQDLLNIVCKGKIKMLHSHWNVLAMSKNLANVCDYWLPDKYYDEYMEARKKPYIIHYSDKQMPDQVYEADFYDVYWKYAKETPFYEVLLLKSLGKQNEIGPENREDKTENNVTGLSENLLFRTKVKRKFVMPVVNIVFPRGSRSRERVKTIYGKFREKVVWH